MYKLYDFKSNNETISIIYNEVYEQLYTLNNTTLKPFSNDDCITIIESFENVTINKVCKYFIENSFDELQERFINKELNENSIKLYQFIINKKDKKS